MATNSSVLAWRIPGTGEPGGFPSMGSHRVGHDWSDLAAAAYELFIVWILTPCQWLHWKYFSQSIGYLFVLLVISFAVQKLLSFIRSYLFLFACISFVLDNWSKKTLVWFMSENILLMFSSRSFMVSCLIFTSLNYFVHGVTEVLALLISYRLDLGDFLKWDLPASQWGLRSPFYCSLHHSLLYFTRVTPLCYPPGLEGSWTFLPVIKLQWF